MKFDFLKEDNNSVAKAAFWYMICQVLVRGISFLSAPLFTRIMTREAFGYVSNFTAWEAILFPLLTLNFRASINKSKYDFPENNDSFLTSILMFANIVTIIVWLVLESFGEQFCFEFFGMDMFTLRILLLQILFHTAFEFQQIQHNIYRKYKHFVFYSFINSTTSLLLSIALVYWSQNKALGRILGNVIPGIIINSFIISSVFKKSKIFCWKYIKYALSMSIPLLLSSWSSNILHSSDKILISKYCGSAPTALYAVPATIASIAAIAWTAMNQAWGPWLYDNLDKENFVKIKTASESFALIYCDFVLYLMLFAPEILYLYGGSKYIEATSVMPAIILAMVFQFFYAFYFDTEYFYGETYIISLGTFLSALLNVILNYIFIPQYGYIAAAYTTLVGYMFMWLYHFCIVKYKLKKSFIFNTKYFLLLIIILLFAQTIIAMLHNLYFARYAIIGILTVLNILLLFKHKNTIASITEKIFGKFHFSK